MNLPSEIECDCCRGVLDIEREQDIERLRQVARLQKSQLEHLIAVLARKCSELEKLKGSGGELQIALQGLMQSVSRLLPDVLAIVIGAFALTLLGGRKDPRIELPPYEHIKNEVGRRVEYAVQVRRGRTGVELVAELEDVLAERLATLRSPALTDSTIIAMATTPSSSALEKAPSTSIFQVPNAKRSSVDQRRAST